MAAEGNDDADVRTSLPQSLVDAYAKFAKALYVPAGNVPDPGAMGMFGNPLTPYGSRSDQLTDSFYQNRMLTPPGGAPVNPLLGNKSPRYQFATFPANVGGDVAGKSAYSPGQFNPFSGRGGSNSGSPQFAGRGNGPQGGNPGNGGPPPGGTGGPPPTTDPGLFNPYVRGTPPPTSSRNPPPTDVPPYQPGTPPPPGYTPAPRPGQPGFGGAPGATGATGATGGAGAPGIFNPTPPPGYNGSYPTSYPLPPGAGQQPVTVNSGGYIPNPTNDPKLPNYDPYLPGPNGAAPEKYGNPNIMDVSQAIKTGVIPPNDTMGTGYGGTGATPSGYWAMSLTPGQVVWKNADGMTTGAPPPGAPPAPTYASMLAALNARIKAQMGGG